MPSSEREGSRDRDIVLRREHSFSDSGRPTVPMWDSSDPERAPPPLPLNPGSPQVATRANTSANIAAAAQAIVEKGRDNAGSAPYASNAMPDRSPEKSLIKGAHHRRLQSLQTGSVRDLRSFIDGGRSPERSPTHASRASKDFANDYSGSSPERSPSRSGTPTPSGKEFIKETPTLRPSTRPQPRPILGENTPPSATMLALQTMPVRDTEAYPGNISSPCLNRNPVAFDAISTQISSLTSIATSLQREMAQLSRRSKDNATDLISLKEATNTRDEDIRKTLRELVNSVNYGDRFLAPPALMSRSTSSFGNGLHFLDNKAHSSPPSAGKSFALPRIPSVNSFAAALESERAAPPSPYSVEGAASVAMLEKIIREMVTKEGQERLLSTLSELLEKSERSNHESEATAKKVEELVEFIKKKSQSQALVPRSLGNGAVGECPPKLDLDFDNPHGALAKVGDGQEGHKAYASPRAADFVSADMLKLLRKIKDSVGENGGMTAEVKALVRELRGEVLGMGRELGRKIEEREASPDSLITAQDQSGKKELEEIIRQGLAELREHMERVIRENRRQSSSSNISQNTVDAQQVYDVVKHTLASQGLTHSPAVHAPSIALDKEAILEAVKEAYEAYKPEIELQQFGLERDEILQCLREGLEDYRSPRGADPAGGIRREEVMEAVQEALRHFTPPAPVFAASEIRDEVLSAVRECLDDFRFPTHEPSVSRNGDITRSDVLEAVKEGLATHEPNPPRELEINRDDLYQAVKAGLDGRQTPFGGYGEQVLQQLHELVEGMRIEFKQYSAANGRDTEQVLDAVKDGLESLRAEIETYVDRAQDVTGKDEIIDTVRGGLEQLRADVEGYVTVGPRGENALSKSEILEYIKAEFEHLHATLGSDVVTGARTSKDKEEIVSVLTDGLNKLSYQIASRGADVEQTEETLDAMKAEFEQLRETFLNSTAAHKDEILETFQESFQGLDAKVGSRDFGANDNEVTLSLIREEFAHLQESLGSTIMRNGGSIDKDEVIEALRESLDGLRTQLAADQGDATGETLGHIKEEFAHMRETLGAALDQRGNADKDEILEALRQGLNSFRSHPVQNADSGAGSEALEFVRGELEHLRQSIATTLIHGRDRADTEEILDTVRLGLDDLRSHLEKKLDNPERHMSSTGEILDAVNEGLDGLRIDIAKIVDKPVDMTVSYEILDTLKDGLASVRADIERLKDDRPSTGHTSIRGREVVLADGDGMFMGEMPTINESQNAIKRSDVEKLEVMLAQLQIKMEAMDQSIHTPHPDPAPAPASASVPMEGIAMKADLAEIESLLKGLQATVSILAAREQVGMEDVAKKEDTYAIETLLRNTKAQIEELHFADPGLSASKEDISAVESLLRMTNEAIDALAGRVTGEAATKENLSALEDLVLSTKITLEEIKENLGSRDGTESITKLDLDVLGILCTEIKTKLGDMALPNLDHVASKTDVEKLTSLVREFRRDHEKMSSRYEGDISVTARAFDDRKAEAEILMDRTAELKMFLEDMKDQLQSKLEEGGQGLDSLGATLTAVEESLRAGVATSAEMMALVDIVSREFERAHHSLETIKSEHEEKASALYNKHEEHKTAIVSEVIQKLDARFDEIMTKYDDAQFTAEEKARVMDEARVQQTELLSGAKSMAEDLKLTIDTLGTSLTALESSFMEATAKLSDDSKTVYNRIDDTYSRLNEAHTDLKADQQLTRGEIVKAIAAVNGLQGEAKDFHPRFMDALTEVLVLVGKHYDHFKTAHEQSQYSFQNAFEESRSQSRAQAEEMKSVFSSSLALTAAPAFLPEPANAYDDKDIHSKLDSLLGRAYVDAELSNKLDTLIGHASRSEYIHSKLEQLSGESAGSTASSSQLERLDQMHQQLMATAAEVSQFVSAQANIITVDNASKEKAAEELGLMLERRLAQKDEVETRIADLVEERESLRAAVEALQLEKDSLCTQKARLTAEVSSLETALHIRREELHTMDSRADALERRIVEGVLDHSRALLLTKTPKGPASMSLKRVTSNMSQAGSTALSNPASAGLGMALKTRHPVRRAAAADRRILSLNEITNNVPTGGQAYSAIPRVSSSGFGNLKRSHSVKTKGIMPKSTWSDQQTAPDVDKENEMLSEGSGREDHGSDADTERLSSYHDRTDSNMTGSTGSYRSASSLSGITPSNERHSAYGASGSEYMYGTDSYMTGSETDRRTSYGSTIRSQLGTGAVLDDPLDEESASDGESGDETGPGYTRRRRLEASQRDGKDIVVYNAPSDSGLGTDLPSATVGGAA